MNEKHFFSPTRFKLILFVIVLIIFPWQLFFKQIDYVFFIFLPLNVFISYFDACLFVHLVKLAKEYKKKH